MNARTCTHTYTYTYTSTYTRIYPLYIYTYTHLTHTQTRTFTYEHAHTHVDLLASSLSGRCLIGIICYLIPSPNSSSVPPRLSVHHLTSPHLPSIAPHPSSRVTFVILFHFAFVLKHVYSLHPLSFALSLFSVLLFPSNAPFP